MDKSSILVRNLRESVAIKEVLVSDSKTIDIVNTISDILVSVFKSGHKLLFCGNGGSAADAQHLAAEFSGRYYFDRPPLFAEALHVNSSYITAVANDYSYEEIFSRIVSAMGKKGDVLIGLSTSGNSKNVINAMVVAKEKGLTTVGFTGQGGGKMKSVCDYIIEIPSFNTPRIQEAHMIIGHSICEFVENKLFK